MTALPFQIVVSGWINRLDVHNYKTEIVCNCLSEMINVPVQSRQDQEKYILLIEEILDNAQFDWICSDYSKDTVLQVLNKIDPDLQLFSLTSLMYQFSSGSRLDFVMNLIQHYFQSGQYKALLLHRNHERTDIFQQSWEKLIISISSLPDHIANKMKTKNHFPLFHHERFFVFIGIQIAEVLEELCDYVRQGREIDTNFLAYNIGQFCLRGKTEFVFKSLLPLLTMKTRSCFLWRRISQKLFHNLPDRSYDKLLTYLFKRVPSSYCLSPILGDLVLTNSKVKFVILHKLLFSYSSSDCVVPCNVIDYLASAQSTFPLVSEVMLKLLGVWSSMGSIKHTPFEQHRYITSAILKCAAHLKGKIDDRMKRSITIGFMEGVKNHIESPDAKLRTLGMITAEKLANLTQLPDQKEKLTFDYEVTPDTNVLLSLDQLTTEPDDAFYERQVEEYRRIKSNVGHLADDSSTEVVYGVDKSAFIKMAASQRIDLQPADSAEEPTATPDLDDIDSDDDLVPYDMPEEKPFSKVPRPMYIRDCLDGLIENKDRSHMEVYLGCVCHLVESDSFAAKEIGAELCRVLLNLQDDYSIDDFHLLRRKAMTSVLICDPKQVATYITGEFYSEHYNLQQRMDMLDVLVLAAGRLGGLEKEEKSLNKEFEDSTTKANDVLSWKEVVERRIESKTRRFGKMKRPQQTNPDRFGPVAGYFFFPLMAGYDRRIRTLDLLGTDSMVLGRLLYALGTILYTATHSMAADDMALSLLRFVAELRRHAEAFVRKACIYCVTMTSLAVRSLTERLADDVLDARDWLSEVVQCDSDNQARELASNTLALLSKKVRDELSVTST